MPSTIRREDEIDKRADEMFNSHPDLQDKESRAGSNYTSGGIDQAESYANDPTNSSRSLESKESARDNESTNQFGYSRNNQPDKKSRRIKLLKKAGPTGGIIGLIIGGIFGLGVFISPSLAVVHIKEILTEDLDDQLGALDERSVHVFRAKLKDDLGKKGSGITCTVKVRCDFKGMSDRQLKAFRAAGIDVDTVGDKNVFGKTQVRSLTFTSSSGKKSQVSSPKDISKLRIDKNIRNQLRRAYNPKFYGLRDAVATKVFGKLKTNPAPKIKSNNTKEIDAELAEAVKGETLEVSSEKATASEDDSEDEKKQKDTNNEQNSKFTEGIEKATERGGGVKGVFKSLGTGTAKGIGVLGAADSACSVYQTSLAVSALAKVKRATDLARFAMVFLNFADSVKAGDATPEQAEYIGNKLSYTDTEKKVVDETSTIDGDDRAKKVNNPDYGKSAFDSQAMMAAQYNDAPNLSARSLGFAVGGGLSGRMDKVNQEVANFLQTDVQGVRSVCKKVQNGFVRFGSLVGGVALGIVTFGGWTAVSVGASVGISLAMPILQSYLADIVAGTVVTKDTKGVDAGNAIFSGSAVLLGSMAATRGMKPSNKSDLQKYQAFNSRVKQEYIAMETEDDSKHPFDASRQYSFLGKLTRSFIPASQTSNKFSSILGIFKAANNSLTDVSGAVGDFKSERFSKCNDENYKAISIDADIMCNVRYSMSSEELKRDLEATIDWMLEQKHIDESGSPTSDSYKKWLKECVDRTDGWGEESEDGGGTGEICTDDSNEHSMFRTYTFDRTVIESMDYIPPSGKTGKGLLAMSWNLCRKAAGCSGESPVSPSERADLNTQVFTEQLPDIAGFQEADEIADKLKNSETMKSQYDKFESGTRFIVWKKELFTKLDDGKFDMSPGRDNMPWVKLQSSSGKNLYVVDIHAKVDEGGPGSSSSARKEDGKKTVELISKKLNDAPTIIVGDMNSQYPGHDSGGKGNEIYDAFNAAGYKLAINEATTKTNDDCQTSHNYKVDCGGGTASHIDQIWIANAPDASVNSWELIKNDSTQKASDHRPIVADISIPGISNKSKMQTGGSVGGDDYKSECRANYKGVSFISCSRECVDFVLFRLAKHGIKYTAGPANGGQLVRELGKMGFTVSQTPSVNAVFSTSATSRPSVGHTGMVSKVNPDGSIVIEEYNFTNGHAYGTRTMTKAQYTSKGYVFANTGTKYQ